MKGKVPNVEKRKFVQAHVLRESANRFDSLVVRKSGILKVPKR